MAFREGGNGLRRQRIRTAEDVLRYAETHRVNNRVAAYMLAIERVAHTLRQRGIYAWVNRPLSHCFLLLPPDLDRDRGGEEHHYCLPATAEYFRRLEQGTEESDRLHPSQGGDLAVGVSSDDDNAYAWARGNRKAALAEGCLIRFRRRFYGGFRLARCI